MTADQTVVAEHPLVRWWRGLGRGQRAVAGALAVVVAANLVLAGVGSLVGNTPGGPASSAFSTGGDGLEGYADLLRDEGHVVVRLPGRPTARDLPSRATVVLADPTGLSSTEAQLLARFVTGGGRLVVAGERGAPLVSALAGPEVSWYQEDTVDELQVWVPVDGTGAAESVAGDGGGRWSDPGSLLPVAGADGAPAVLAGTVGQGRLLALADASILQNANLSRADNAALALAAAGPVSRPVVFVDARRAAASGGLDAIPSAWKWVAAGLGVAFLVGLWSAGTRFGPPEPRRRALRPPRRDHVDAVAADLDRVEPRRPDLAQALVDGTQSARRQQQHHHRPTVPETPGATP